MCLANLRDWDLIHNYWRFVLRISRFFAFLIVFLDFLSFLEQIIVQDWECNVAFRVGYQNMLYRDIGSLYNVDNNPATRLQSVEYCSRYLTILIGHLVKISVIYITTIEENWIRKQTQNATEKTITIRKHDEHDKHDQVEQIGVWNNPDINKV